MCVAPKPRAASSFRSSTSTAMIVVAPTTLRAGDGGVADTAAADHRDGVTRAARRRCSRPHRSRPSRRSRAGPRPPRRRRGRPWCTGPTATSVFSTNAPMPSAGVSSVPSVSVIFCVALWVAKQYQGLPLQAGAALAAHRAPVEDDEVARRDVGDAVADRLDDAGGLVAEQEREVVVDAALAVVQVGVAHPARLRRAPRPRRGRGPAPRCRRARPGAPGSGDDSLDGLRHGCSSHRHDGGLRHANAAPIGCRVCRR